MICLSYYRKKYHRLNVNREIKHALKINYGDLKNILDQRKCNTEDVIQVYLDK